MRLLHGLWLVALAAFTGCGEGEPAASSAPSPASSGPPTLAEQARAHERRTRSTLVQSDVLEIALAALKVYEREIDPGWRLLNGGPPGPKAHVLCLSAQPVPAAMPTGARYMPSSAMGADFDAGDHTRGWKCLQAFGPRPRPLLHQLEYRAGGPYKGPARGGPEPGESGFEASAEGDVDGNGRTSLFTVVGRVDAASRELTLSDVFISDEFE